MYVRTYVHAFLASTSSRLIDYLLDFLPSFLTIRWRMRVCDCLCVSVRVRIFIFFKKLCRVWRQNLSQALKRNDIGVTTQNLCVCVCFVSELKHSTVNTNLVFSICCDNCNEKRRKFHDVWMERKIEKKSPNNSEVSPELS